MAGSRLGSMKALYLEKISGNPERLQEKNSQTVMGAKVFEWNLLCALLEHGTYDAYLSPGVTEEGKRQLVEEGLSAGNVDRLRQRKRLARSGLRPSCFADTWPSFGCAGELAKQNTKISCTHLWFHPFH